MSSQSKRIALADSGVQRKLPLSRLSSSIMLLLGAFTFGHTAYAMESMDERAMSDTTGSDGVAISIQADSLSFGNLYWQDQIDTSGTTKQLQLTNASLKPNGGTKLNATAQINVGSSGTTPALSLNLNVSSPFLLAAPRLEICASTVSCANNPLAYGNGGATDVGFAFQTTNPTSFTLETTNGLFNSAGTAKVTLLIDGANTFFSSNGNQIVGADIRANISANGKIWIDATDGLRFSGDVAFIAANAARSGLQASLMLQSGTSSTYNSSTAGALVRLGMSGNLLNTQVYVRGTKGSGANEDSIGSVVGNQGIVARLTGKVQSGALTAAGTGPGFQLEFSGASPTLGYGIQITDFIGFSNVMTGTDPLFDSGNIYLNLISNVDLPMPTQAAFTSATTNTVNFFGLNAANAFTQLKSVDTQLADDSVLLAVRGLNLQSVPLQTYFYQTNVGRVTNLGTAYNKATGVATSNTTPTAGFALMPVLNNVNANLAISGQANSIGYSLAVATTGSNGQTGETGTGATTDVKTTSLFLADTANKQYIGLRNLDMFLQADGAITLTNATTAICVNNCINISLKHLLFAMKAGFAVGYLPGAEPGTAGAPAAPFKAGTPFETFASTANTDTLFNMSALINGLSGSATNAISLYTNANGALGIGADITLAGTPTSTGVPGTGTSFLRLSQPCTTVGCTATGDGATLGLDGLTGRIQLAAPSGSTPGTYIYAQGNSGTFATTLNINPQRVQGQELLGTLNFYADSNTATAQPLGKFVVTGGQVISTVILKPVTF